MLGKPGLVDTPAARAIMEINNASAMFSTRPVTVDGLECTFALNHMGCFLLTNLLLDRIVASAPARIVSVASGSHRFAKLDFDDLQAQKKYSHQVVYSRSKLATVLFTRALGRRLKGTGVTANCLDPGFVRSRFFESVGGWARLVVAIMPSTRNTTPAEACKTSVYLASAPEVEKVTGVYFVKCRTATPSKAAQDDAVAERLWVESLRLAGIQDNSA